MYPLMLAMLIMLGDVFQDGCASVHVCLVALLHSATKINGVWSSCVLSAGLLGTHGGPTLPFDGGGLLPYLVYVYFMWHGVYLHNEDGLTSPSISCSRPHSVACRYTCTLKVVLLLLPAFGS